MFVINICVHREFFFHCQCVLRGIADGQNTAATVSRKQFECILDKEALFCCFDQENHKMHLFELTSSVMRVKDVKTEVTIRIN